MEETIGVVIPFYQRETGLLNRALRSAEQAGRHTRRKLTVIVTDDGSPLKPEAEVVGINLPITILRQSNSGPGAARNQALKHLPANVEYISFLDSDDAWDERHLATAEYALDKFGADFFFADFTRPGEGPKLKATGFRGEDHLFLDAERNLYEYSGELLLDVLRLLYIGTSTIVYRKPPVPLFSPFETKLRNSHEDTLAWLRILKHHHRRAVFTTNITVHYGEGVNIYHDSGWENPKSLARLRDEILYKKIVSEEFDIPENERRFLRIHERRSRGDAARHILHYLRRGLPGTARSAVWEYLRNDPAVAGAMVGAIWDKVVRRA